MKKSSYKPITNQKKEEEWNMHYLTLGTLKIPPQEPTPQKDQEIREQLAALEKEKQDAPDSWLTDIFIQKCNSLRDSFSRAVASEAERILERYSAGTTNPDYLEFCDKTEDVTQAQSTVSGWRKAALCLHMMNV